LNAYNSIAESVYNLETVSNINENNDTVNYMSLYDENEDEDDLEY